MASDRLTKALTFLSNHGIPYERYDHPAVVTVDEVTERVDIPHGQRTKNLFVRDKRGRRHILIVVPHDAQVDLMQLGSQTGLGRVSFASERRLLEHLDIEPGSVSLMGVINDPEHRVEVIVDRAVWHAEQVRCHPLVNTATLVLKRADMHRLFELTGHQPIILDVPTC